MKLLDIDLSKYKDITYKLDNRKFKDKLVYQISTKKDTKIYEISNFKFEGDLYTNAVVQYTLNTTNEIRRVLTIIHHDVFYKKYK